MDHPKAKGDKSVLAVMMALHEVGIPFFVPFGENTRCDLVLELPTGLVRVQCKTGRLRGGAIIFATCSSYGHHRNPRTARRDYLGQVDYFAVYCPETSGAYLIPISDLPVRVQATLRATPPRNNQRRYVRYANHYEIAKVSAAAEEGRFCERLNV